MSSPKYLLGDDGFVVCQLIFSTPKKHKPRPDHTFRDNRGRNYDVITLWDLCDDCPTVKIPVSLLMKNLDDTDWRDISYNKSLIEPDDPALADPEGIISVRKIFETPVSRLITITALTVPISPILYSSIKRTISSTGCTASVEHFAMGGITSL